MNSTFRITRVKGFFGKPFDEQVRLACRFVDHHNDTQLKMWVEAIRKYHSKYCLKRLKKVLMAVRELPWNYTYE